MLEQSGLRSSIRGGRFASDSGVSHGGGIHTTPVKQCINCIERRGGSAGVIFASAQHSRQHTELPDLSRRPLDAPARRKALTRESRHVSLQTDGQIAKLPCCFAPHSAVGGRNHDRPGRRVRIVSCSPGARHRQPTRVHPFHWRIARCARVGTTTWRTRTALSVISAKAFGSQTRGQLAGAEHLEGNPAPMLAVSHGVHGGHAAGAPRSRRGRCQGLDDVHRGERTRGVLLWPNRRQLAAIYFDGAAIRLIAHPRMMPDAAPYCPRNCPQPPRTPAQESNTGRPATATGAAGDTTAGRGPAFFTIRPSDGEHVDASNAPALQKQISKLPKLRGGAWHPPTVGRGQNGAKAFAIDRRRGSGRRMGRCGDVAELLSSRPQTTRSSL